MLQHRKSQPRSLSGKVVAITGAARGIGFATARALANQGAVVAVGDLDGDLTAQAASKLGGDAFGVSLDVPPSPKRAASVGEPAERSKA